MIALGGQLLLVLSRALAVRLQISLRQSILRARLLRSCISATRMITMDYMFG